MTKELIGELRYEERDKPVGLNLASGEPLLFKKETILQQSWRDDNGKVIWIDVPTVTKTK